MTTTNHTTKVCPVCQTLFKPIRQNPNQIYCCMECYTAARPKKQVSNCVHCGKAFKAYPSSGKKYCSISCGVSARNLTSQNPSYTRDISGEKNPMFGRGDLVSGERNAMTGRKRELSPTWKGGKKHRKDGYIRVIAPGDHPFPCEITDSAKYILEHRLVMEQHLGRYLLPTEVVHHIDNNPSNNAIENLQLFSSQSEHIRLGHGHKKKRDK